MARTLIILAAGRGTRLGPAAEGRPKAATVIHGRSLLEWQTLAARRAGFERIIVITGYRPELLPRVAGHVEYVNNPVFDRTNMVFSLFCARERFGDEFALSYGDIVYAPSVLETIWTSPAPIACTVDRGWRPYWEQRFADPLSDAETLRTDKHGSIIEIGAKPVSLDVIEGQYIGLTRYRAGGVESLLNLMTAAARAHGSGERLICAERAFPDLYMTDVLQGLIRTGTPIRASDTRRNWLEIDTPSDLALATKSSRIAHDRDGEYLEILQ